MTMPTAGNVAAPRSRSMVRNAAPSCGALEPDMATMTRGRS
jgi:hypothetical protein